MEHLSLPRGAKISDSERAYCIAEPYDGGSFLSFPQRSRFADLYLKLTQHGWPSSSWQATRDEILELDVFLQTWLFFGLLHEVFGVRAPASTFVDQHSRITTAKLGEVVDQWTAEHKALKDRDNGLRQHPMECITTAWNTGLISCRTANVSVTILRSIAALCETLEDVILGTLSSRPRTTTTTWGWLHSFNDVERKLVENGWCPATATKDRATANTFQGVYYLSKLQLRVTKNHSGCIGTVCIANQSELYTRASQHASDCQEGCPTLGVDEEKLTTILASGQVGLLDVAYPAQSSALIIDVVRASKYTKYVAISHVWADGLGNPNGNQLPRCQLARIVRMVRSLQELSLPDGGKLYLWLDTLCCPVKSTYHRTQCLVLMRQIYSDATHVLVLDAELNQYDSHEIDSLEVCARLLFSVWSTRLWTLQEGALARRGGLWVQLRDRAINVEVIGEELIRRYGSHFVDGRLTLVLTSHLARLRRFIDTGNPALSTSNLVDLRMAVSKRSVSVATDEPLCLATCMGLDQTNIAQAAPEERMEEFWISMRRSARDVPSNILFFYGERLKTPGLRFAPVSFLERVVFNKFWLPRQANEVGVMTDIGLRVLFPAYEIVVPSCDQSGWDSILDGFQSGISIRHSSSRWYRITIGCNVLGPWTSLSMIEVFRRNGGRNVILTTSALELLSFEREGADLSQAISAHITMTTPDGICVSVQTTILVGLMTEHDASANERAWQIALDSELQTRVLAQLRDFTQQTVSSERPNPPQLSNVIFEDILRVASSAIKDRSMENSLRSTRPSYLASCILRFLGGWYGQIQQTWPRSQQWFVD